MCKKYRSFICEQYFDRLNRIQRENEIVVLIYWYNLCLEFIIQEIINNFIVDNSVINNNYNNNNNIIAEEVDGDEREHDEEEECTTNHQIKYLSTN